LTHDIKYYRTYLYTFVGVTLNKFSEVGNPKKSTVLSIIN